VRKKKKTREVIFEKLSFNKGAVLVREGKKKKMNKKERTKVLRWCMKKKKMKKKEDTGLCW
jgi:hypothetical protein